MKKTKIIITLILFILFSITATKTTVLAAERKAIYFKEFHCLVCNELAGYPNGPAGIYVESDDYLKMITDQGIDLVIYDLNTTFEAGDLLESYNIILETNNLQDIIDTGDLFAAYNVAYGLSKTHAVVPVIFVGDQYFKGYDDIVNAYENNVIYNLSDDLLLDVIIIEGQIFDDITGIAGFFTVLFAGLLDGFNPCAIAMLLLFVSLLGFTDNKKVLILVSITYISALFVSYFLIGTFLLGTLIRFQSEALLINQIISWFVALLCSFLFLINIYDFIVTKKQDYAKVKNQLPAWIIKYNKKLIKSFTNAINNPENKRSLFSVLGLTFVLGIAISVTELICTGQIYLGILYGISFLNSLYAYIALLAYNFMFVLPLIVIAVLAIKGKGVVSTSNWIREHLHIIKLLNAMLFLTIAIYFFTKIF